MAQKKKLNHRGHREHRGKYGEALSNMQRVMCIWIPDWPMQRLAIERPDLHGRTVVIYEASPQGGLKVVAATSALGLLSDGFTTMETCDTGNLIAGIYPGMPLAEATALIAHAQVMIQSRRSVGNAHSLPAVAGGV